MDEVEKIDESEEIDKSEQSDESEATVESEAIDEKTSYPGLEEALYRISVCDEEKKDIVVTAILEDNYDLITFVLDLGCDVNIDQSGMNMLHLACACLNSRLVGLFLNRGFDMYEGAEDGSSPLDVLKDYYKVYATQNNTLRMEFPANVTPDDEVFTILKMFYNRGLVLDADDQNDRSIVQEILTYGTKEIVQLFAEHEYDFNFVDETDRTVLQRITVDGKPEVVEALLEYVDVNFQTSHGTALHVAARSGNIENARVLLKYGADVDAVNDEMVTPLPASLSLNDGSDDMCRRLLISRSGVNNILSDIELMRRLIALFHMNSEIRVQRGILAHHAIAMRMANFPVDDWIYSALTVPADFNESELKTRCADELKRLRKTYVAVGRTYYELMTDHTNNVAWWLNKDVQTYFETHPYACDFPSYCDSLYVAYKVALTRRKILETNGVILLNIFYHAGLNFDMARIIISYLNDDDLMNLISAYKFDVDEC